MFSNPILGDDYIRLTLEKMRNDVIGSYHITNEENNTLGKTEGYTIRRRSILCSFIQSNNIYEILKRERGHYLFLKSDKIVGAFKLDLIRSKIELKTNELVYQIFSENLGFTYSIKREGKDIGIVNSNNWLNEDIGIAIRKSESTEFIILAIIGLAYDKCSSPSRFFK